MSEQNPPAETPQQPAAPASPQTAPPVTPQPPAPPQEPSTPQQPAAPQPPAAPEQPTPQEQPAALQQGPALVWTSGDFQEDPGTDPPYNGLQLTVVPAYSEQSLVSVAVTILDFTYSQTGVPVTIQLEPATAGKRMAVQPPSAAPQFTVRGTLELRSTPPSLNPVLFLFIDLHYGLPDEQHHAEGGILEIPQVLDLSSLPAAGPSQGGGVPASAGGSSAKGGGAAGGSSPATAGTSSSRLPIAGATTPSAAPPDVVTALQAINASLDRIAGTLEKLAGGAPAAGSSSSITPNHPQADDAPITGTSPATAP